MLGPKHYASDVARNLAEGLREGSVLLHPTDQVGKRASGDESPWLSSTHNSSMHSRREVLFDENFINALGAQKADAENLLFEYFSSLVKLKLQGRLRSPELIEDAYQETFLRVLKFFRSGKRLVDPASLPGFVHSVCQNIAWEFQRAHTRQSQLPDEVIYADVADTSSGQQELMVTEQLKSVEQLLKELPERDRQLIRVFLEKETEKDRQHFVEKFLAAYRKEVASGKELAG
jgi:RNA polymerase sigma factor (sigma-70 family)